MAWQLSVLDKKLRSIQFSAHHMELQNTEQRLASIGLTAYQIDPLKETNNALKSNGPECLHGDRRTIKKKSEQHSPVSRNNIDLSSISILIFP